MNDATINADVTMAGEGGQSLLANRYHVIKQLGQGGMGSVWLAEDTVLDNRKVAIKMLPSILFANKRAYNQLKSEALVAMKLSHSNIAAVRSFEENDGNPFIVEDYIEGLSLDNYLAEKGGTLTEEEMRKILAPIAAALDYAHREGVVHRDVKPANVMIRNDGTPFVLDFGIAREAQETMTMVTGKLSSGTLLYMSPEQLRGQAPAPAQDIYSFAAMAYECISGHPPFFRGAIEDQIKNEPPPDLGPQFANCGPLMAGLAKDPKDRPATCAAVLSPGGISKSGGTPAPQAVAASKDSSRKLFPIVALLMLLLAILGGLFAWRAHERSIAAEAREVELVRLREQAAQEKSAAEAAAERIRETEAETAKRLAAAKEETERLKKALKERTDGESATHEVQLASEAVTLTTQMEEYKTDDVKTAIPPEGMKQESDSALAELAARQILQKRYCEAADNILTAMDRTPNPAGEIVNVKRQLDQAVNAQWIADRKKWLADMKIELERLREGRDFSITKLNLPEKALMQFIYDHLRKVAAEYESLRSIYADEHPSLREKKREFDFWRDRWREYLFAGVEVSEKFARKLSKQDALEECLSYRLPPCDYLSDYLLPSEKASVFPLSARMEELALTNGILRLKFKENHPEVVAVTKRLKESQQDVDTALKKVDVTANPLVARALGPVQLYLEETGAVRFFDEVVSYPDLKARLSRLSRAYPGICARIEACAQAPMTSVNELVECCRECGCEIDMQTKDAMAEEAKTRQAEERKIIEEDIKFQTRALEVLLAKVDDYRSDREGFVSAFAAIDACTGLVAQVAATESLVVATNRLAELKSANATVERHFNWIKANVEARNKMRQIRTILTDNVKKLEEFTELMKYAPDEFQAAETSLHEGDTAFETGDFSTALACYTKATEQYQAGVRRIKALTRSVAPSTGEKGFVRSADNEAMHAVVELTSAAKKELLGEDFSRPVPIIELGVKRKDYNGPAGEFVGRIRLIKETPSGLFFCDILPVWSQTNFKPGDIVFVD